MQLCNSFSNHETSLFLKKIETQFLQQNISFSFFPIHQDLLAVFLTKILILFFLLFLTQSPNMPDRQPFLLACFPQPLCQPFRRRRRLNLQPLTTRLTLERGSESAELPPYPQRFFLGSCWKASTTSTERIDPLGRSLQQGTSAADTTARS